MNWNWKEYRKKKHQFKGESYCVNCQQKKSCGILDEEKKYCCACYQKILEELEEEGLLINSAQLVLNDYRQGVISCRCLGTEKPRIEYINSDGSGWSRCEGKKCEKIIDSAGHHRVIKNRNNPGFWGLECKEKVLCGECLEEKRGKMPPLRKAEFNRYRKMGRL